VNDYQQWRPDTKANAARERNEKRNICHTDKEGTMADIY